MKTNLPLILLSLLLISCLGYEEVPVESDYSYKGKFQDYNTFGFSHSGKRDSATYNSIIQDAIIKRMELRGYEYTQENPRLLISYRIFHDSLLYNGYHQPDIEQWIKEGQEENKEMIPQKYNLTHGTLLVLFFDNYQDRTVWQGYASGVMGTGGFYDKVHLHRIVMSIFDKYNVLAKNYKFKVKEKKDQ